MSGRVLIAAAIAIVTSVGVAVLNEDAPQPTSTTEMQSIEGILPTSPTEEVKPTCDGTTIISNCTLEDVNYETYIYHPAIPEKSRTETVVNYRQEVSGYCTLCRDGTYSPSCATGRGACSHHGGVAQWNAPIYRNVPEYSTQTIVETPAREAYFETVLN